MNIKQSVTVEWNKFPETKPIAPGYYWVVLQVLRRDGQPDRRQTYRHFETYFWIASRGIWMEENGNPCLPGVTWWAVIEPPITDNQR